MGTPPRFDGRAAGQVRAQRNMTGADLAKLVGISKSHLYQIEIGDKQPSFTVAAAIAGHLGVPLEQITTSAQPVG